VLPINVFCGRRSNSRLKTTSFVGASDLSNSARNISIGRIAPRRPSCGTAHSRLAAAIREISGQGPLGVNQERTLVFRSTSNSDIGAPQGCGTRSMDRLQGRILRDFHPLGSFKRQCFDSLATIRARSRKTCVSRPIAQIEMAVFRHLRPIGASAGFRLGSLHRRDNIFAFHDVDIDNSQARRPAASCKASRCHCGVRVASARASVASATDNQRKLQGARANRSSGGDKLIASARWNRRTIAGPDVLPGTSRRPPRFAWWRRMYGIRSRNAGVFSFDSSFFRQWLADRGTAPTTTTS
jgi:hypothetical protein